MNPDEIGEPLNEPWREIGLAICRSLNIDERDVTGLTLNIEVGDLPQITIRRRIINDDSRNLASCFTLMTDHYRIESAGDQP